MRTVVASLAKREVWVPARAEVKVHNHFLAELIDKKTGSVVQTAEAENVVTNAARSVLADDLFGATSFMGVCYLGSGSAAPSPTDVKLQTHRAVANVASSGQVTSPDVYSASNGVWYRRRKYLFSELVANFSLAEVGLGWSSTSYYYAGESNNDSQGPSSSPPYGIRTRALFKDANGNPISITKNSSQQLIITATVYFTRGGVDDNIRLLDNFFTQLVQSGGFPYGDWRLGDGGGVAPTNAQNSLQGTQLAAKTDPTQQYYNRRNRLFWEPNSGSWWYPGLYNGVQLYRPTNMPYVTSYAQDWELQEANVTFSEVLVVSTANNSSAGVPATHAMVRLVFPCGNVGGTSFTKTSAVKLRQYFELIW